MTLKALLSTTPFEEMIPHLESLFSREFNHNQIGYCRMAYDELQHVRPKNLGYSMRIVMRDYGSGPKLQALDIEGMPWSRCLGYEMEIAEDVTASNAEIAAQCLWGLTFYGYSRSRKSLYRNGMGPTLEKITKEYGVEWDKNWDLSQVHHKLIVDEISSRYCGHQNRVDYIADIAEKYMAINFASADKVNINICVPESHPLTDEEKKRLNICARNISPTKDCNFSIKIFSQQKRIKYVKMVVFAFRKRQITEDKVLDQLILQTTPMDFTLSARVVGIVLFEANNPDLGDNVVYQRLMALARIGKLEIKQTKGCRANVCDTNAIYELPMRDIEVRLKTPL